MSDETNGPYDSRDEADDHGRRPDRDYTVGYGKPPIEHQFKPGQSGNPSGRPKGRKSLDAILDQLWGESVPVLKDGVKHAVCRLEAMVRKTYHDAMNGDRDARKHLFRLAERPTAQASRPHYVIEAPAPVTIEEWQRQYTPNYQDASNSGHMRIENPTPKQGPVTGEDDGKV